MSDKVLAFELHPTDGDYNAHAPGAALANMRFLVADTLVAFRYVDGGQVMVIRTQDGRVYRTHGTVQDVCAVLDWRIRVLDDND